MTLHPLGRPVPPERLTVTSRFPPCHLLFSFWAFVPAQMGIPPPLAYSFHPLNLSLCVSFSDPQGLGLLQALVFTPGSY